jgi:DNA repair exonuclease SbcCD ATPase subunit
MSEIITGLRIRNFLPFRGEHELALGPGAFAVVGETEEDPRRSNWSGKSSFLATIRFVLTGDHPKQTEDAWITNDEEEGGVEAEFSGGAYAERFRTRGGSTKLRVVIPDGQGAELELRGDHAQEALDRLTGTSKDEQLATWWSRQKEVDWFITEDPGIVTAQIAEWCGIEKVRDAAGFVAEDLTRLLKEHDGWIAIAVQSEQDATDIDVGEPGAREALQARADALQIKTEKDAGVRAALAKNEARARDAEEYERLGREITAQEKAEPFAYTEEQRTAAMNTGAEAAAKVLVARQTLTKTRLLVRGKFDGQCPVRGGFDCPAKDQLNSNIEANAKADEAANAKYEAAQKESIETARLANLITDGIRAGSRWSANLEDLRARQDRLRPAWVLFNTEAQPAVEATADWARELQEVRSQIEILDRNEAWKAQHLKRAEESRAKVLALLPEITARREALLILGPGGAQRRVAERMLSLIEQRANELLQRSGVVLGISFQWARETQQPAEHCATCGLPFPSSRKVKACTSCNAARGMKLEHKFRAVVSPLSGGAEDLAGLAVRLAANAWLRAMRGSAWRVACIDEPFGALDAFNRHAVTRHLVAMLADEYGVEQSFVTAHDSALLASFPRRIKITAGANGSRVEVLG